MKTIKSGKFKKLVDILSSFDSALLAYSGGADSTFLLKVCRDVLKDKILAVTSISLTLPLREKEFVKKLIGRIKVRHMFIKTQEMKNAKFVNNGIDRCYWCKKELFSKLLNIAKKLKIKYIIEGSNTDDKNNDYRPGLKAAKELGIMSPLIEAGINKAEVRKFSKMLGLLTWDKPSSPCLATRIPYGVRITACALKRIEKAEDKLKELGFNQVRVRDYENTARIEVSTNDFSKLLRKPAREKIVVYFKELGYDFVTLDLRGYRQGNMNEAVLRRQK